MDDSTLFDEVLQLTMQRQSGDATDEQLARLERLLGDSQEAVVYYLKIVEDGLAVREAAEARANAKMAEDVDGMAPALDADQEPVAGNERNLWRSMKGLRFFPFSMAMAATILLLFSLFWGPRRSISGDESTARVTSVSGVKWADGARQFYPWSKIVAGDTLELGRGIVNVFISSGVDMFIEGPAEVRFDSLKRVIVNEGQVAARVGPDAIGFCIETPHANVIDRGTSFGVSVEGSQQSDVVVYDGIVDLDVVGHGNRPRRRLAAGEALRVNSRGDLSRIASVRGDDFLLPPEVRIGSRRRTQLIESVADTIRLSDTAKCNRVILGGFEEDCRAYVDREHEWNGIDASGLPECLLGGDYVMTFNDDKTETRFQLTVELARPAHLYVLIDNRVPPPDWLVRDFIDTKFEVGLDEVHRHVSIDSEIGPGVSLDQVYTVWRRDVKEACSVVLGPLGRQEFSRPARVVQRGMYGIVATPLVKP